MVTCSLFCLLISPRDRSDEIISHIVEEYLVNMFALKRLCSSVPKTMTSSTKQVCVVTFVALGRSISWTGAAATNTYRDGNAA